jgi:hypothetical protein
MALRQARLDQSRAMAEVGQKHEANAGIGIERMAVCAARLSRVAGSGSAIFEIGHAAPTAQALHARLHAVIIEVCVDNGDARTQTVVTKDRADHFQTGKDPLLRPEGVRFDLRLC